MTQQSDVPRKHNTDYGNSDDPEMVVGSLRGYRFFAGEPSLSSRIFSTTFKHEWKLGINVAECKQPISYGSYGRCGGIAGINCRCGFHAAYNYYPGLEGVPGVANARYVGVVNATGRVVLGSQGFRAEKMEILGLATVSRREVECWLCGDAIHTIHHQRQTVCGDFPWFKTFKTESDLIEAFPPDDVSELLREREQT